VSCAVKKRSLKKLKLLKKEEGFWFVINVLGSIIKHEEIMIHDTIVYSLRMHKEIQCGSFGVFECGHCGGVRGYTLAVNKSSIN
jgi:hypothetical protein